MPQLLIGCGNRRIRKLCFDDNPEFTDLVTLDHDPDCGADIVHDLEDMPWPLDDNAFDEIHAYEVLEHLGTQGDAKAFFAHFGEIYRALKPGGHLMATVPAWNDPWAWGDPSHRRVITQGSLVFLDQTQYTRQIGKTAMTDFRRMWRGDFELAAAETVDGAFRFALQAHKPARQS